MRRSAERINDIINENTKAAKNRKKYSYDRFVKNKAIFRVGDMVKINNYHHRVGICKAFEPKFLGPYKIVKLLGDLNYELEAPNMKTEIVHYNCMQHFHVRDQFCAVPTIWDLRDWLEP